MATKTAKKETNRTNIVWSFRPDNGLKTLVIRAKGRKMEATGKRVSNDEIINELIQVGYKNFTY